MSERQDFSDIGEKIRGAVQEAVQSGDFGQLNDVVNDTVNGALDEVRVQVNRMHDRLNRTAENTGDRTQFQDYSSRYRTPKGQRAMREHRTVQTKYASRWGNDGQTASGQDIAVRNGGASGQEYSLSAGRKYFNKSSNVPGILFTVFGGIGLGSFGAAGLGCLIWALVRPGLASIGVSILFVILAAVCGGLLGKGCSMRARLKRAERYLKLANEKMYMQIEELAMHTGQNIRHLKKDIKSMLQAGIFPEGHMDAEETVLVLNDATWEQYLETRRAWENKKGLQDSAGKQNREQVTEEELTEEQQIEKDGQLYMDRLRRLNDEIPGEVISNKLDELDRVLQSIFSVLKEHPEKCPQMRKFMDYYLPTTVKLVESYAEFDRAGIQGENIQKAKAEIEKTMDTIQQAFIKLLDDMYRDAAFEAAADARVLKTVLAQDGYMESAFSNDKK